MEELPSLEPHAQGRWRRAVKPWRETWTYGSGAAGLRTWRAQEETGLKEQTGPAQSLLLAALATGPSSALMLYENLHLKDEHTYPA